MLYRAVATKRPLGETMNDSYDDAEYQDHARTWEGFTRFMTGSLAFVVVVLVGMAALLL